MNSVFSLTLFRRSFGLLVVTVASLVSLLFVLLAVMLYRTQTATMAATEQTIMATKAAGISQVIGHISAEVASWAEASELAQFLESQEGSPSEAELLQVLAQFTSARYEAIYILDDRGVAQVSTDPRFTGNSYEFREYFQVPFRESRPFVDVNLGATSQEIGLYFSYPIRLDDGEILGVLVAKVDPSLFEPILASSLPTSPVSFWLSTTDGVIILASDNRFLLQTPQELNSAERKELVRLHFPTATLNPIYPELTSLDSVLTGETFELENVLTDRRVHVTALPIDSAPLIIGCELPVSEIHAAVQELLWQFAQIILIVVLLFFICASFILKGLVTPFDQLKTWIGHVTKGKFTPLKLHGWYRQLWSETETALNQMAQELHDQQQKTESQVTVRTQQLEKLNQVLTQRELKMIELKKELQALHQKMDSHES